MTSLLATPRLNDEDLRFVEARRIVRAEEDVRDKSYRRFPLGQDVGRYLRTLRVEGKAQATLDSYETVLRMLVLEYPDWTLSDYERGGEGPIVDFLFRRWSDSAPATLRHRRVVLIEFFKWAKRHKRISENPAERIKTPRPKPPFRVAHEPAEIGRIAAAQSTVREEAAVLLMGRLGLRKNELRMLRARDVDLLRDRILVHGKGGKTVELPIVVSDLRQVLALWLQEAHREEYLLYPKRDTRRPLERSSLHRWWVRVLERAGSEHFPMHELRHSAADHLWRLTGDLVLAQQLLRHESANTTRLYLHPSEADLRAGLRLVDEAVR